VAEVVEVEQHRCALCKALFVVCTSCFRGQAYCSASCRSSSSRSRHRAASDLHQRGDDGRKDHRDRQRAYEARKKAAAANAACGSLTDATSRKLDFSMKCPPPVAVIARRSHYVSPFVVDKSVPLRCCVCGAPGTHIVSRRSRAPP
jgi:hypothetical protein